MSVRNICGGSFKITSLMYQSEDGDDDDGGECDQNACKSSSSQEEVKQGWFLRPDMENERKKKRYFYVKQLLIKTLMAGVVLVGLVFLVMVVTRQRHRHHVDGPDKYTVALHQALMFFNAQRSGRLPLYNNVSWRNDSCLKDDLIGGYYDAGNTVKFTFPASFAMTMLSWSVIEYSEKYAAAEELDHVKGVIKWGTDYLLETFNSSAGDIGGIVAQVGGERDQHCWMRPEDIDSDDDYPRPVSRCSECPALAGEMAAALAAASIVFKESTDYSKKLVHGAEVLFKFARISQAENYSGGTEQSSAFYNSSGFWDEFVWAGAWLHCATGKLSYLQIATRPGLVQKDAAFFGGSHRRVLSWNNKHVAAQLLLTRMRLFLGYGYPYEETLRKFQKQVEDMMCSYLPAFPTFKRTKGGLIQLNHGRPRPLQYVVNAVFVATLYSDYLESNLIPGWQCGPQFISTAALRDFARNQMDYILGKNPNRMSYIVGYGEHFPMSVHHRGSSIPNNNVKYGCEGGWKWRASRRPNPNIVVGAMVAGPDEHDNFKDIRSNYNYTEPTIAGNAGLVAALVALSGGKISKIDKNTIFYAIPPLYVRKKPPPAPWKP